MSIFNRTETYKGVKVEGIATSAKNRFVWRIRALDHSTYDSLADAKKAINDAIAKNTGSAA